MGKNKKKKVLTFPTKQSSSMEDVDQKFWKLMKTKIGKRQLLVELKQLLARNPEHLGAQFELFLRTSDALTSDDIERMQEFTSKAKKHWLSEGTPDWGASIDSQALPIFLHAIDYYLAMGLYGLANDLCDFIISRPVNQLHSHFLFLLFSTKNLVFDFHFIEEQYFSDVKKLKVEDFVAIHYLIACLVHGEFAKARAVLEQIVTVHPESLFIFKLGIWPTLATELDHLIELPSDKLLYQAIVPLQEFILERKFIVTKTSEFAHEIASRTPGTYAHFMQFYEIPEISVLQEKRARILYDVGIQNLDDFKNWTVDDLLAIDGIGKTTITHLQNQGITFKS
ncbi:hypothetical protein ACVR05_00530 [Streptococcus caprae]|uniref:Helicase n=1 Tax=Streptococcus caprae TaxID=1640501 RepID=A0ABV8CXE0_9STRE